MRGRVVGFLAIAAVGISLVMSSEAQACAISDFSIKQPHWRRADNEYVEALGELVNNCGEAAGAEVQVVFRDKTDTVLEVEEFWPAHTKNITAHDNYPFSRTVRLGTDATAMSMRVIDVKLW